jgi:hypothetical protein
MLRHKNSRDLALHIESQFYLPGDEIVGTVSYHPKKQVSLRFVRIIFAGEEYCIWIDKVAARVGGPVASSRAPLFRKETNLVAERTRLDAGPHSWQFRFYIPRSIPPTCNYYGKASVSYWLKAKAATSFGHFDARCRTPVTIGQFWVPNIPAPVSATKATSGGSILMNVKSSQSVVKCGDMVTLTINFHNSSSRNLTGVRVKLKQVWECTGVFYHKNIVLKYLTREGFPASRGPHNTVIQVKIPHRLQTCPTVTNASRFKCTYYLAVFGVTKVVGGLVASDTVKCRIPITITNLPSADPENEGSAARALDESSSESSESDSEVAYPRSIAQTASESSLRTQHAHDLVATRSLSALNAEELDAIPSASNSVFDFLNNYSQRSQRERDSQGNFNTQRESEDLGLGTLFDEELQREDKEGNSKKGKEVDDGEDNHNGVEPNRECIICYDGQKNMLLLPCAHIATCVSCTSYIMYSNKLCPVCRTKITQTMRIYPV